jgi:hypothetical protein
MLLLEGMCAGTHTLLLRRKTTHTLLPYRLNEWSNDALTGGHVCWHAHAVVTQKNDAHAVAI